MGLQSGPATIRQEFQRRFDARPALYQAPGRINIIGEHTDYNGGLVLPATVDLHTRVAIAPRPDAILNVYFSANSSACSVDINCLERDGTGSAAEYVKGTAWALQREGFEPAGADILVAGTLPLGGGLSSSASLESALAYALLDQAGHDIDREVLARACHRAETEFVGVPCGVMDQVAIAMGRRGHAMKLDCRTLATHFIPLPANTAFLLVNSGVRHALASGEYRRRTRECAEALGCLRQANASLRWLCELTPAQLAEHAPLLSARLLRRCQHVISENQRVREACTAMRTRQFERLGQLMSASHESLRSDYEVSCPELDELVKTAMSCEGVLGARMMGGGFGGCIIALVTSDQAAAAMETIANRYVTPAGTPPWAHVAASADAVHRVGTTSGAIGGEDPRR